METEKKKIAVKDWMIILISLAAFAALIALLLYSRRSGQEAVINPGEQNLTETQNDEPENVKKGDDSVIQIRMEDRENVIVRLKGSQDLSVKGYLLAVNGETEEFPEDLERLEPDREVTFSLKKPIPEDTDNVVSVCDSAGNIRASVLVPSEEEKKSSKCFFSDSGGFYPDDVRVQIHAPDGWKIYYTTDGTTPTEKSKTYLGSVPISNHTGSKMECAERAAEGTFSPSKQIKGTFLRVLAVSPDGKEECRAEQSYFVGVSQDSAIRNLPVLAIGSDPDGIVSYENGIYVAGRHYEDAVARGEGTDGYANYYDDVSRDAYAEFFENGKDKSWEGSVKLSTLKDGYVNLSQRGLVLDHLSRKVMKGSSLYPYTDQKKIYLYNGGTDNMYKIRDRLASELTDGTSVGAADVQMCTVFLDGEYWGVYMMRTPCDESMIRRKYEIKDTSKIQVSGTGEESSREFKDFVSNVQEADLSVEENYKKVEEQMDIDSYIQYLCFNMFLANADFGKERPTIWRTTAGTGKGSDDGRWRWILGSMQNTMDNGYMGRVSTPTIDTFFQPGVTQDLFLQSLLKSPKFCEKLEKTMKDLCGKLKAKRVKSILDRYTDEYGKAIRSSYIRFFGAAEDKFFQQETAKITAFFDGRAEYIMKYTQETVQEAQGG